jgi:hypothetical protein
MSVLKVGRAFISQVILWLLVGVAPLLATPAVSAEAIVLGDSIGQGIATTIGLKSLAKRSFSLRRGDIGEQLKLVPNDAVALMSLGLNDAADPVEHLTKFIERVVDKAADGNRKTIWIGPPCVLGKAWDVRAEALDAHLKHRLATTAIQYVSLRDKQICSKTLRTGDGEHFTVEGYRYVWEKIKREAPFASGLEADACERQKIKAVYRGKKATSDCSKTAQ